MWRGRSRPSRWDYTVWPHSSQDFPVFKLRYNAIFDLFLNAHTSPIPHPGQAEELQLSGLVETLTRKNRHVQKELAEAHRSNEDMFDQRMRLQTTLVGRGGP